MINLILYSTSHCHLCEQAEALLTKLSIDLNLNWMTVEITDEPNLYARYEIKIPVLKRLDTSKEICWPFNEAEIRLLLEQNQ